MLVQRKRWNYNKLTLLLRENVNHTGKNNRNQPTSCQGIYNSDTDLLHPCPLSYSHNSTRVQSETIQRDDLITAALVHLLKIYITFLKCNISSLIIWPPNCHILVLFLLVPPQSFLLLQKQSELNLTLNMGANQLVHPCRGELCKRSLQECKHPTQKH